MKKSLLLVLSIPLLAGCSFSSVPAYKTENQSTETPQGEVNPGSQEDEKTEQGTEGSEINPKTQDDTETSQEGQNKPDSEVDHDDTEETDPVHGDSGEGGGGHSHQDQEEHIDPEIKDDEKDDDEGGSGSEEQSDDEGGSGTETGGQTEIKSTTITKMIDEFGFINQKDVTEFNLADDLKVTCAKGDNKQNSPKYYSSDAAIRLYGKNTITFTSDKDITKICFTFSIEDKGNDLIPSTGSISKDRKTWTGSAKSITFTIDGSSGKACINSISVTYGGSGNSTGGGTTGGETTGGETTGGGTTGGDIQSGNGNTSHSFTSPWEGIQKDIVYQMFKGNLPHYTDFNKYEIKDMDGSTIPYFNPYEESNWSKDAQKDYDLALKEMGYKLVSTEPYMDEDGNEDPSTPVNYYEKGTFKVQTSHYQSGKLWYFDVYAYNDYVEADPCFSPKSELDRSKITLKSGYQSFNYSGGGYNYSSPAATRYSDYGIQIQANSKITITGNLNDMNILFVKNACSCVVYAGTSTSNLSPVYNDACNYKFPSGTKVVEIRTLDKECIVENICVD